MNYLWCNIVFLFAVVFQSTYGHSWLDCVKDIGTGLNTGVGDCKGFARNYPGRLPGVNVDEIMTYRIQPAIMGQNPPICAAGQRTANSYSNQFPRAKANAGETLKMRWTPNGHQRGAGQNPLTYTIHWTGKAGTQLNNRLDLTDNTKLAGPFPFDEECFCNNCAGNPCYGRFTIPANLTTGTYSFIWYWIFNRAAGAGGEEYTTCFDVDVTGTTNNQPPVVSSTPKTSMATSNPRTSAQTSNPKTSSRSSTSRTSARTSARISESRDDENSESESVTIGTNQLVTNTTRDDIQLNAGYSLLSSWKLSLGLISIAIVMIL